MNMKKLAIIVEGTTTSGKTPAIKTVAIALATHGLPLNNKSYPIDQVRPTAENPDDVTMMLYQKNFSVGIESDCDVHERARKNHDHFIEHGCDLILCAAHGKQGDSEKNNHKDMEKKFVGEGYECKPVKIDYGQWSPQNCKETAEKIIEIIREFYA